MIAHVFPEVWPHPKVDSAKVAASSRASTVSSMATARYAAMRAVTVHPAAEILASKALPFCVLKTVLPSVIYKTDTLQFQYRDCVISV